MGDGEGDLEGCRAEVRRLRDEFQELVYVVSHDLKEPLRAVVSYLRLLSDRCGAELDGESREFIGFAMMGARRMQKMLEDLLVFSRVSSRGSPAEWVEADRALDGVMGALEGRLAEVGGQVVREELPRVWVDPVQLEALLEILLENAVDYRSERPLVVRVGAERRGGSWEFAVADNGVGVPEAQRERVFGVFQRLARDAEDRHAGMGLAIARRVVERVGGRIWCEAAGEAGARFRFTIPIPAEGAGG